MLLIISLIFLHFALAKEAFNCDEAPDDGRRQICEQIQLWNRDVKTIPQHIAKEVPRILFADAPSVYECMDTYCICNFLRINNCINTWGRSYRKEYRMLTDDERRRYHNAMWRLKQNGDYFVLSNIHAQYYISPGAHSGPAFFPWHREYMKRMEIALRRVDPLIPGLPYWDSTLDYTLPRAQDSVLWSDELMGSPSSDGFVRNGAFANWTINDGSRVFQRSLGTFGQLFSSNDLQSMNNFRSITQFLGFTAPESGCPWPATYYAPEYVHGKPHVWVGGDMLITRTSTYDPLFYLHHSFVDWIWEAWRQVAQTPSQRTTDYPPNSASCSNVAHFSNSTMLPFNKNNSEGLSNQYFDYLSSYAPRPTCTWQNRWCGSKYLFCDVSHGQPRCASKVMLAGNCTGYTGGEDVCYNGQCSNGVCVTPNRGLNEQPVMTSSSTTETSTIIVSTSTSATSSFLSSTPIVVATQSSTIPASTSTTMTTTITVPTSTTTIDETCFNEHVCCNTWARSGDCFRNPGFMMSNCKPSCSLCRTSFLSTAECGDRHPDCENLLNSRGCSSEWMAENCRQTCDLCGTTRSSICANMTSSPNAVTAPPPPTGDPTCLNHHYCCLGWAATGYCSDPNWADYMTQYCSPACGFCAPGTFPSRRTTTCSDSLSTCAARNTTCNTNSGFMKENCKETCGTCWMLNLQARMFECGLIRTAPTNVQIRQPPGITNLIRTPMREPPKIPDPFQPVSAVKERFLELLNNFSQLLGSFVM